MNVDYWIPDSEERDYKLSDIPSPTDMANAIARVRDLHKPFTYEKNGETIVSDICKGCEQCWGCGENGGSTYSDGSQCPCQMYPCATIKALDGEQ